MSEAPALQLWAQQTIERQITDAAHALACHCRKPRSAKRLHTARKALARLRSALDDVGALAGVTPEFRDRVVQLHRRAGKVRDADVLIHRTDEYLENAAHDECLQLKDVRAAIRKRRKKGRRKLDRLVRRLPQLGA